MNTRVLLFLSFIGLSCAFFDMPGDDDTTANKPYLNEDGSWAWDFLKKLFGLETLSQETKAHWITLQFRGVYHVLPRSLD